MILNKINRNKKNKDQILKIKKMKRDETGKYL
jgi:hypothetical protein